MSASLEAYLARLYLDADARRAFAADPRGAAARAGLELTARSLQAKRQARPRRGWLARLLARWCLRYQPRDVLIFREEVRGHGREGASREQGRAFTAGDDVFV